jgi:hypothetical protein
MPKIMTLFPGDGRDSVTQIGAHCSAAPRVREAIAHSRWTIELAAFVTPRPSPCLADYPSAARSRSKRIRDVPHWPHRTCGARARDGIGHCGFARTARERLHADSVVDHVVQAAHQRTTPLQGASTPRLDSHDGD